MKIFGGKLGKFKIFCYLCMNFCVICAREKYEYFATLVCAKKQEHLGCIEIIAIRNTKYGN